jgi:serine/threonine-protein kinase TTK/MPS1
MGPGCKIYALKRIKLAGRDEEAASGFIDEINLLNSLRDKPNIIQLVESQVGLLLLVLMLLGGKERG